MPCSWECLYLASETIVQETASRSYFVIKLSSKNLYIRMEIFMESNTEIRYVRGEDEKVRCEAFKDIVMKLASSEPRGFVEEKHF